MWKCVLNSELSGWRNPLAVANIGGCLEQVKGINLDLGMVVTDFKRHMAFIFGRWTAAMGSKALCWETSVLQVCTHLCSAKAGLERALWRPILPENVRGNFQHFGLFRAYPHERLGLFFVMFKKNHRFPTDFGEPATAISQSLPIQQHLRLPSRWCKCALPPGTECCLLPWSLGPQGAHHSMWDGQQLVGKVVYCHEGDDALLRTIEWFRSQGAFKTTQSDFPAMGWDIFH